MNSAQTLVEAFDALAGEVQSLSDRNTVLEHKLRFAHEQLLLLLPKNGPVSDEIAAVLAQIAPAPRPDDASVPLPRRQTPSASSHHVSVLIRNGRRAAAQLAVLPLSPSGLANRSISSRDSCSRQTHQPTVTTMSTVLERDFTVEGRRGTLGCPLAQPRPMAARASDSGVPPVCSGLEEEVAGEVDAASTQHPNASKCPIRFLDHHSAEEVAEYVERHKHEIPRSHEVCLQRFQGDGSQMRRMDQKYGDVVSMIEGLSQLHKPMLPEKEGEGAGEQPGEEALPQQSRVATWAQGVSEGVSTDSTQAAEAAREALGTGPHTPDDDERLSHFERTLGEVRVGESPSRPWGIPMTLLEATGKKLDEPSESAKVEPPMPADHPPVPAAASGAAPKKCPFNHAALAVMRPKPSEPPTLRDEDATPRPKSPPAKEPELLKPVFIGADTVEKTGAQMVFHGPVFIGYSVDDAIKIAQQLRPPA